MICCPLKVSSYTAHLLAHAIINAVPSLLKCLQAFAIELAIDFIPLAVEFSAFAVEFIVFAVEFVVVLALSFVAWQWD